MIDAGFLAKLVELLPELATALGETLTMLGIGLAAALLLGGPLGILLFLVGDGRLLPNRPLAAVLGWTVNTVRSFPFIILLVALVPFTRMIAGSSIGPVAAAVPLSVAAIPYFARLVEQTLREVPRRMSTLDHLSGGRVGWNIVTGYLDSAARNLGLARQLGHDARYDLADEYLDVVYKLWEKSWDDDAVVADKVAGVYTGPARVHPIAHHGQYYTVPGIHLCEPSPQRTPFLYQAGTSPRGLAFAARHAEATFVAGPSKGVVKRYVDDTRAAARAAGRDPEEILVYAQALIVTAPTAAQAEEKYQDYLEHVDVEAALALLSGWTGVDFSRLPLDATIDYIDTDAGRTALASLSAADPTRRWTVREAARFIGLGGRGPVLVGDPGQVADQLEGWLEDTGVDGFNLAFAVAHESMRDVVDLVVPELQRRGRYRKDYEGGTLRAQLLGRGDRLAGHHPGRQVSILPHQSAA